VSPVIGGSGRHEQYIGWLIMNHVMQHSLGRVYSPSTGFLLARSPDTVLSPDVSFIHHDRLPTVEQEAHFLEVAPDLAVEVLSQSNRRGEIRRKVRIYLEAGIRCVWVADPGRQSVSVWIPDQPERVLSADDVLDGGDVLPGFHLRVADLFQGP
jgi:Uma2 family endonuclease